MKWDIARTMISELAKLDLDSNGRLLQAEVAAVVLLYLYALAVDV